MKKEYFNKLVADYSELDSQFEDLEKLVQRYPYSQPVRMLNVKSSAHLSKVEFQQRLGLAAFYSTDRNVLRSLIELGQVPSDLPASSQPKKKQVTQAKKKAVATYTKPDPEKQRNIKTTKLDGSKLREEVLHNLDELLKSKKSFLKLIEIEHVTKPKKSPSSIPKKARKTSSPTSKPATIKKLATKKSKATSSGTKKSRKDELIDKFIADEPTITPNKVGKDNQSDLSQASSELKEDLVSENLAVIFANQGKTAKAIEIYKKLIWKFPQKKASFAARIEELKKK